MLQTTLLFIILAVTVEAIVEYARTIAEKTGTREMVLQLAALGVSVLLCTAAGVDIYTFVGVEFTFPWIGCVLTGIFASRGANYASDLLGRLQAAT